MLHDKLITENFLHRVQKERSLSPQNSPTKMDLYNAYRFQIAHRQLQRREETEVLDLSRRCDSVETPPRKTPSPYQTISENCRTGSLSPNNKQESFDSSSLPTAAFAANIQKLYAQHSTISTSVPGPFPTQPNTSLRNSSPGMPIYPIYYPVIKTERESSPTSSLSKQPQLIKPQPQLQIPIFPQTYHPQANLLQSINIMKAASFPPQNTQLTTENLSPKSGDLNDDRISEASNTGSPSSSIGPATTTNRFSKLAKSTGSVNLQADTKAQRPFKAFPRDPLVIAANFAANDVLYDHPRVERYTEYRKRVLEQIRTANGGERTITNPKMRRTNNRIDSNSNAIRSDESHSDGQLNNSESEDRAGDSDNDSMVPSTTDGQMEGNNNNNSQMFNQNCGNNGVKDAAYFERRRKNNAAAKKSRDRRRIKEDEIAIRAAYLERQNIELLCQLDALKAQLATLTKC